MELIERGQADRVLNMLISPGRRHLPLIRQPLAQRLQDALTDAAPLTAFAFAMSPSNLPARYPSARGSLIAGGRFNLKGAFEVLYLS